MIHHWCGTQKDDMVMGLETGTLPQVCIIYGFKISDNYIAMVPILFRIV